MYIRGRDGREGVAEDVVFYFLGNFLGEGPGEGAAEEACMVLFRGGPGEGVAEEDTGAGRRAAAEGREFVIFTCI